MRKTGKIILAAIAVLLLTLSVACTPAQADILEGILQNVDAANGEITIVTKDGKTVTVTIATDASVETEGTPSTLENLEPGVSVEVEVNDDGQVARRIKAQQAEIEGVIVGIEGDEVTIETERGHRRTLVTTDTTRIELDEDFPGMLSDLQVGMEVEVKFDPTTQIAFKFEVEEEKKFASEPGVKWGIVEIRVTDPPPADVKSAVIHLSNIEVHRVSGNTSGWITIIGGPSSFDLMDVIGITEVLGRANITAGKYTQIRMDVTEVTGETADGVPYTAEVPGGKLKIVRPFNVDAGTVTVLTLDFDGEKSLIRTGNNRFLFKPVVKLLIDKEKAEQGQEQDTEELELEGTIDAIDGNIWMMTIDGETRTVDVSQAEIEGEPAVGLLAEIEGTVVGDTIMASEVEIKETE